ncbi:type II toxin-antitoxin system RelE/ParE family toxin [Vibrio parahaemolyticus]|uniref:type II toxin-antitoxin system RelE/ParE family toxin n=1 Tax=Vibrio parahaemolyticus TaxID=670 RepID=UPI0011227EDE|nr:type II toxin-antitoxin system RelE/ParE family toxin [Vibrio parahaemolyticus]TOE91522.1 hypothetical protein CGJ32_13255 [Vibrio parahaemolyticus]
MYKLSQKAADDFGDIYEYTFLNFGAEQADNYTDEMEQCLQTLSEAPFIGRDCSELRSGVQCCIFKLLNFLIKPRKTPLRGRFLFQTNSAIFAL